ncbi:MAG TPA: hypothetical protein VFB60_00230 [Ktedonobacteraceae bacterium]|nr:hypothetical protein [Ktedonobacteraceae bacterium]
MKLKELLQNYDLHDGSINSMYYDSGQKKVVIDVDLCNWGQPSYRETEPDLISGKLIFTGVSQYKIETEMPGCKFDDDEILMAKLLPSQREQKEIIQITLLAFLFPEKKQVVKVLQIEAEDVVWEVSGFKNSADI